MFVIVNTVFEKEGMPVLDVGNNGYCEYAVIEDKKEAAKILVELQKEYNNPKLKMFEVVPLGTTK